MTLNPQFITDTAGKRLVILPMKEYKSMLDEIEQLEDIKRYDKAKTRNEKSIPIDIAFKTIEANRKKLK